MASPPLTPSCSKSSRPRRSFGGELPWSLQAMPRLWQRQILNRIGKFGTFSGFGQQFQIINGLTDGQSHLGRVNDTGKYCSSFLSHGSFDEEVFILRKQDSAQFRGPAQQLVVTPLCGPVLLSCEHIHS